MSNKNEKELLLDLGGKIDNLVEKVHSIDITVAKQEINLQDHMRRTAVNEEKLEIFENKIAPALDAYKFVFTVFKFIVPVITLLGIYYKYWR